MKEKLIIGSILFFINAILSTLLIIFNEYWYAFISILALSSLISSINVLLILGYKLFKTPHNTKTVSKYEDRTVYVMPCYNETEAELISTINSIAEQEYVTDDKYLVIICDGKLKSADGIRTDDILVNSIFKPYIHSSLEFRNAYKTWTGEWRDIEVHSGRMSNLPFLIFVKDRNCGKRDSLVLIRRLLHTYNQKIYNTKYFSDDFSIYFNSELSDMSNKPVSYIIGTDADTILHRSCSYNLTAAMKNASMNTVGAVGFVDIVLDQPYNPLLWYQYAEYIYAQCLKRYAQSVVTGKVNCLSGCVQILKVCDETCGEDILQRFNRLPEKREIIFNHIRSYASEDRNHICEMFKMYPYVQTIQAVDAIAYTHVPTKLLKLLKQRKRWTAGATCNDMLIATNQYHNRWERLVASISIMIACIPLFINVATIEFIISLITNPSILMLYLSTIMIIPLFYFFLIPVITYRPQNLLLYYWSILVYYTLGTPLNLLIYFYTLFYLDDLNWNVDRVATAITAV